MGPMTPMEMKYNLLRLLFPEKIKREIKMSSASVMINTLTHYSQETRKRVIGKQCRPDQMPQNMVSDQGLRCLQIY